MKPLAYSIHLRRASRPAWRPQLAPRRDRPAAPAGEGRARVWARLNALPRWVHVVPHAALVSLGAGLLVPGVVPRGPGCGEFAGYSSLTERQLFIQASAVGFGLIAALLLISALVASAQRRAGRPGLPTIVSSSLLGVVTLGAVLWPHIPTAAPAIVVMAIDVFGLLGSHGAALVLPALVGAFAWSRMDGPRSLGAAQVFAWITLLVVLPLIMAETYLMVTPICFD